MTPWVEHAAYWVSGAYCGYTLADLLLRKMHRRQKVRLDKYIAESEARWAALMFKLKLVDPERLPDVSKPSAKGPRHRV